MIIPPEFAGRVYRTRLEGLSSNITKLSEIVKEWPGSEIDVIYEKVGERVLTALVIVFETAEDHTAFTLKHGYKYV